MPINDALWKRLRSARREEVEEIANILWPKNVVDDDEDDKELVRRVSAELRRQAGTSIKNAFRGEHDLAYEAILRDVARKMTSYSKWWNGTLKDLNKLNRKKLEELIWRLYSEQLEKKLEKVPIADRNKLRKKFEKELRKAGRNESLVTYLGSGIGVGGAASYTMASSIAYTYAMSTASGFAALQLWWVGTASTVVIAGMGSAIFGGLFAPCFALWLTTPAYQKVIPCVVKLIHIRKLQELEKSLTEN